MLNKSEFIKQYNTLNEQDRAAVKKYHEDIYKNAIFPDTFNTAEELKQL